MAGPKPQIAIDSTDLWGNFQGPVDVVVTAGASFFLPVAWCVLCGVVSGSNEEEAK